MSAYLLPDGFRLVSTLVRGLRFLPVRNRSPDVPTFTTFLRFPTGTVRTDPKPTPVPVPGTLSVVNFTLT